MRGAPHSRPILRADGPTEQWESSHGIADNDRKASYYSTIQLLDPQTLKVSGCILGGLICKSQTWHRVPSGGLAMAR